MARLLDIEHEEYHAVWKAWKLGSLLLFAAFVAVAIDIARSLRHHCRG